VTPQARRKPDLGVAAAFLFGFALASSAGVLVAVAAAVDVFKSPARRFGLAAWVIALAAALIGSMLLATIRSAPWAARAAAQVSASLLLCLAGTLLPAPFPTWLLPALLVLFVASTEPPQWTQGIATLAGLLIGTVSTGFPAPGVAGARGAGIASALIVSAAAFALFGAGASLAFSRSRARAAELRTAIARLRHGVEFADDGLVEGSSPERAGARRAGRETGTRRGGGAEAAPNAPGTARFQRMLRSLRDEARTGRDVERVLQLERDLGPMLKLAQLATQAHSALFFTIDPSTRTAFLRAALGPDSIRRDARLSAEQDPIAFVVDRGKVFYATEFRSLLWSLPYYQGEVRVGSLLAAPVFVRGAVLGALIVDHLETQAFADREAAVTEIAALAAHVIEADRETLAVEERRIEFEGASALSQRLALLTEVAEVHALVVEAVQEMAPKTIGAGLLRLANDAIEALPGAPERLVEWLGTGRKTNERTWLAWQLQHGAEALRLDTWSERPPLPLFRPGGGFPGDSLLMQPLRFRNRLVGVLIAVGERGAFDGPASRVLALVANQAAAAIVLLELIDTNRALALRDGLTGLLNRRAFDEDFARAVAHALRSGQPVSLVMLDLDRFKALNDQYGHLAGDQALQLAAEEIRKQTRGGDLAARYGGEEFALILPGTDGGSAFRMAERVRKAIEARPLEVDGDRVSVTASLGVAATDQGYLEEDALIRAADEALYASKQTGRNRSSLAAGARPR
jgi:diguanylate cyclase (GGDEF)-like protein